jgi:hypothetical protein
MTFDHIQVPLKDFSTYKAKAHNFDDIIEFYAETFWEELLDKIGEEKCIEHFDLKLQREPCWKDERDRRG